MKHIFSEKLWNRKKLFHALVLMLMMLGTVSACGKKDGLLEDKAMLVFINGEEVSVEWESNESVNALKKLAETSPLSIKMSKCGGFEQVGPIGASLPRNDAHITSQPGDILLYSGNQIVVFYGSNSWSYTRLGKIRDRSASELEKLLGAKDAVLTIKLGNTR